MSEKIKLDPNKKILLLEIFPQNILNGTSIYINSDLTYLGEMILKSSVAAITFNKQIYFSKDQYINSHEGISLLAHEMTHIYQINKYGMTIFGWKYAWRWLINLFKGYDSLSAYMKIEFEEEAREIEDGVFNWLNKNRCHLTIPSELRSWIKIHPYQGKKLK